MSIGKHCPLYFSSEGAEFGNSRSKKRAVPKQSTAKGAVKFDSIKTLIKGRGHLQKEEEILAVDYHMTPMLKTKR
jgi:hypothetical protein